MARAVQEKAANGGRFPPFWIVPDRRHQVGGVACIELYGGFGRPAVLAQPRFEVSDQARLGMLQSRRADRQTPISTRCWRKSLAPKMVWWLRRPPVARGHRQVRKCSLNAARSISLGIAPCRATTWPMCAAARKYRTAVSAL